MRVAVGFLACVTTLFIAGCCKKKEVKVEKKPRFHTMSVSEESEQYSLLNEGMQDEQVFDDRLPDVEDLAFVNDDEAAALAPESRMADEEYEEVAWEEEDWNQLDEEEAVFDTAWNEQEQLELEPIRFAFDSDDIVSGQEEILSKDIEILRRASAAGKAIVLNAYACQIGEEDYNIALTQRRAYAMKKKLVDAGIEEGKIRAIGRGQESPIVFSDATDRLTRIRELSVNRRTEITLADEEATV